MRARRRPSRGHNRVMRLRGPDCAGPIWVAGEGNCTVPMEANKGRRRPGREGGRHRHSGFEIFLPARGGRNMGPPNSREHDPGRDGAVGQVTGGNARLNVAKILGLAVCARARARGARPEAPPGGSCVSSEAAERQRDGAPIRGNRRRVRRARTPAGVRRERQLWEGRPAARRRPKAATVALLRALALALDTSTCGGLDTRGARPRRVPSRSAMAPKLRASGS
jgi:hypothetical protein